MEGNLPFEAIEDWLDNDDDLPSNLDETKSNSSENNSVNEPENLDENENEKSQDAEESENKN